MRTPAPRPPVPVVAATVGPVAAFTLVEPLVLTLMLMIAMAATAVIFNGINRQTASTQQQVLMQNSIDGDVRQIKTLARNFTCCSGVCSTAPPTSFGVVAGVVRPCATSDPRDDRYYFPQVEIIPVAPATKANFPYTTTFREFVAVEQLCASTNNTNFMTPLKTAVDALAQPTGASRASVIQPDKILRVTYTDTANSPRVARVETISPMMAKFCP